MRDFLLSIASPELLSWIGFLILVGGLLGEVAILLSSEKRALHGFFVFALAAMALVGYVISHIGDNAAFEVVSQRAKVAEEELRKIKTRRIITEAQYADLIFCLKSGPKGPVYVRPAFADADALALGERIEGALKESGFEPPPEWREGMGILSWSNPGVFLIVRDLKLALPHAASVQRCLKQVGIEALGEQDPKHPVGSVSIGIGSRL